MKKIVCYSGGKDSTAMLIRLLEENKQVDDVVFADSGFEFQENLDYIDLIENYINLNYNKKITRLKTDKNFDDRFYGVSTRGKSKGKQRGHPLKLFPCYRTREAKVKPMKKYCKNSIQYIGIAFDEKKRISTKEKLVEYPLVDREMTEQDCIDYLKNKGLHNPYYNRFNRGGCYFCPKQNEYSWYLLYLHYQDLWNKCKIRDIESRRISGHGICLDPIINLEQKFNSGYIPKDTRKYNS